MKKLVLGILVGLFIVNGFFRSVLLYEEYIGVETTGSNMMQYRDMGVSVQQFLSHHHDVMPLIYALERDRGFALALILSCGVKFIGKNISEKTGERLNWESPDALYRLDHPKAHPTDIPDAEIIVYFDNQGVFVDFQIPATLFVFAQFPKFSYNTLMKMYWTKGGGRSSLMKEFEKFERTFREYLEKYATDNPLFAAASKVYTPAELVKLSSYAAFDQMLLQLIQTYYAKLQKVDKAAVLEQSMIEQGRIWVLTYFNACKKIHGLYFLWLQIQLFFPLGCIVLSLVYIVIQLRRKDLFGLITAVLRENYLRTSWWRIDTLTIILSVIRKHPLLLLWQPTDERVRCSITPTCSQLLRAYEERQNLRLLATKALELSETCRHRFHGDVPKSLQGLLTVSLDPTRTVTVREDALLQIRKHLQLSPRNGKNGSGTYPRPASQDLRKDSVPQAWQQRKEVIEKILALTSEHAPDITPIDAAFFETFSWRKIEMCERTVRILAHEPLFLEKFFGLSKDQIKGLLNPDSRFLCAVLTEDFDALGQLLGVRVDETQTAEVSLVENSSRLLAGQRVVIFGGARTEIPDIQKRLIDVVLKLGAQSCEFRYCNDLGRLMSSITAAVDIWIVLIATVPHLITDKLTAEIRSELLLNIRYLNAERFRSELIQKIQLAESRKSSRNRISTLP